MGMADNARLRQQHFNTIFQLGSTRHPGMGYNHGRNIFRNNTQKGGVEVKKLIIALCCVFLSIPLLTYRVHAKSRYTLVNLVSNGDFSDGTTSFELLGIGTAFSVVSGELQVTRTTGILAFGQTTNNLLNGNVYYVSIGTIQTDMTDFYMYRSRTSNFIRLDNNNWRGIFIATGDGRISFGREIYQDGSYINIDNIKVFNLTATFGAGTEPSMEEFEKYYLPDIDYFEKWEGLKMHAADDVLKPALDKFATALVNILTWDRFSITETDDINETNANEILVSCFLGLVSYGSIIGLTTFCFNIIGKGRRR